MVRGGGGGSAAGGAAPLSYGEERNAFGKDTARGSLAGILTGGVGRRQGLRPLSPSERRGEKAYGNATASSGPGGPLAGFKRLHATAGQGPMLR